MILKRLKRPKMGLRESSVIKCPSHMKWVRGHECCISNHPWSDNLRCAHGCSGRIEAHHSTTRGAGGGDETVVPLCSAAHQEGHTIGWTTFERRYRVDLTNIAQTLWAKSPHRRKWELEHQ